jgi:hypothetical protein
VNEVVPFPRLNTDKNQIVLIVGRKGSGKSVHAREVFRAWPGIDKLVIDPTGDADPSLPNQWTTMTLPGRLPDPPKKGEHVTVRWVANPASATYREDLDRALGLALWPKSRRVLVWVDEAGEVFPANRTGPNGRTLLQQSRHWYTSLIAATPRPVTIDPLLLAQADRVVIYDLPNPNDRRRVAESIGVEPRLFAEQLDATRAMGEHWFMIFDAHAHELYRCPPLPMSAGYKHAQQ